METSSTASTSFIPVRRLSRPLGRSAPPTRARWEMLPGCPTPQPKLNNANLVRVIRKNSINQSIKVVRNDSLGPRQRHLCRQRFATCLAILMCLPRGQAKGWFVSSEKVPSIKVIRKDCIRPNLGNLYRQRVAKCLAIFMRSTWPSKRLAAEKWPPRLQPPLRVSLCDGSPDLWDGQPLPPEHGGRCCRGVPRPGPRLGLSVGPPPTEHVDDVAPGQEKNTTNALVQKV